MLGATATETEMMIGLAHAQMTARAPAPTLAADREIDARSIVTLIVFFAVNILVLFPIRIPLPSWASPRRLLALASGTGKGGRDRNGHGEGDGTGVDMDGNGNGDLEVRAPGPERISLETINVTETVVAEAEPPHGAGSGSGSGSGSGTLTVAGSSSGSPASPFRPRLSASPSPSTSSASSTPRPRSSTPAPQSPLASLPPTPPAPPRPTLTLGLATAPVAGVLLLLASTCIPGSVVRTGIVGVGGHGSVRPYDVMTLFLSFAYISLSLDSTGLLLFLAFTVSQRAPPNGRSLFTYLYILFVVLALLVGNDPIVLSGTPFVAYFTTHARISPPRAFLFAEFQAANLASALLVSSNPTNLVLTSSFGLSFLQFSAWTALPTLAAAAALYPTLMAVFRSSIPGRIHKQHVVPRSALTDPVGAIFTTAVFVAAIVLLVALSAVGRLEGVQGVWSVTAPAALLVLARDCWHDFTTGSRRGKASSILEVETELSPIGRKTRNVEADGADRVKGAHADDDEGFDHRWKASAQDVHSEKPNDNANPDSDPDPDPATSSSSVFINDTSTTALTGTGIQVHPTAARRRARSAIGHARPVVMRRHGSGDSRALNIPPPVALSPVSSRPASLGPAALPNMTGTTSSPTPSTSAAPAHTPHSLPQRNRNPLTILRRTFPTVAAVIARLPLPLLPFAFSMFILVEALGHTGWITVWARWWAAFARAGGAGGCIVLMGVISVIGCNILGTNIGVTVLLSRVLVVWSRDQPTKRALYGSILSLAVGSNFGAYSFSFPASLAGLLWRDILAQKGLHVRRLEFLRWNLVPLFVTMAVGACVVGAEVCVVFKHGER